MFRCIAFARKTYLCWRLRTNSLRHQLPIGTSRTYQTMKCSSLFTRPEVRGFRFLASIRFCGIFGVHFIRQVGVYKLDTPKLVDSVARTVSPESSSVTLVAKGNVTRPNHFWLVFRASEDAFLYPPIKKSAL